MMEEHLGREERAVPFLALLMVARARRGGVEDLGGKL
jgi:hypothetical protein